MRKSKEEALETRKKILDAALDVFSEKNYMAAPLTDIAARAGVTKGALYWHFKNKDDLLLQLIKEVCSEGWTGVEAIVDSDDTGTRLLEHYKASLDRLYTDVRYKKIHTLIFKKNEWPPEVERKVKEIVIGSVAYEKSLIQRFVQRKQQDGACRQDISADFIASLLSAVFHGLSVVQLSDVFTENVSPYMNTLFNAISHEMKTNQRGNSLGRE